LIRGSGDTGIQGAVPHGKPADLLQEALSHKFVVGAQGIEAVNAGAALIGRLQKGELALLQEGVELGGTAAEAGGRAVGKGLKQ
jgi:hypothetical protein